MRDELRKSDLGAVHVVSGDAGFNARRQWRSGLYNPLPVEDSPDPGQAVRSDCGIQPADQPRGSVVALELVEKPHVDTHEFAPFKPTLAWPASCTGHVSATRDESGVGLLVSSALYSGLRAVCIVRFT
jgi:hypothetical protein